MSEGDLRVWNIVNPPNRPSYRRVNSIEEGAAVLERMAQLNDPFILSGMEVVEEGEWVEWYSPEGYTITEARKMNEED